jgi:hypothetical protein
LFVHGLLCDDWPIASLIQVFRQHGELLEWLHFSSDFVRVVEGEEMLAAAVAPEKILRFCFHLPPLEQMKRLNRCFLGPHNAPSHVEHVRHARVYWLNIP